MANSTDTQVKTCSRCVENPRTNGSYCRACFNALAKEERLKRDNRGRACATCPTGVVSSRTAYRCTTCNQARSRSARLRDPEMSRREYLWQKYRMTLERYDEMLRAQDGHCAICPNEPARNPLVVDHDHSCCPGAYTCGECVRALLCVYCNSTVGKLESASFAPHLAYIKEYSR